MNVYRYEFVVACPNNDVRVRYTLRIEKADKIMVEEIVAACTLDSAYHEDLADKLHARFGGRQTLVAYHHGVWIETVRGDL